MVGEGEEEKRRDQKESWQVFLVSTCSCPYYVLARPYYSLEREGALLYGGYGSKTGKS